MKPNIIIHGPFYSLSGYGSHSRDILLSLWRSQKFNIATIPCGWGQTSDKFDLDVELKEILEYTNTNKFHEGVDFCYIHIGIPTEFKKGGKWNIGITAGLESDRISQNWVDCCNNMDLIIVPSPFQQQMFYKSGVTSVVETVGEGVDISKFHPNSTNINIDKLFETELVSDWNFLTGGQWLWPVVGEDRKQLGLLIKYFGETFKDRPHVGLVIKTFIKNISTPDYMFTKERIKYLKEMFGIVNPLYLLHGDMEDEEMSRLYTHPKIKAFITLTSGEGWGRMISEAISCDLPVIATNWSSVMDYLPQDVGALVDNTLVEIPKGVVNDMRDIMEVGMRWAMVDEKDAKKKMVRCYEKYDIAKEKAVIYGKKFRENYNKDVTYEKLVKILSDLIGVDNSEGLSLVKL